MTTLDTVGEPTRSGEDRRGASSIPRGLRSRALTTTAEWARVVLGAILVPNLIVCARFTALSEFFRGWVNIEFLALAAAYLLFRRPLILALLAADVLIDLFEPVAHLYYFGVADAYESLRFLSIQPPMRLALYAACILGYVGAIVGSFWCFTQRRGRVSAPRPAVFCLALVVLLPFVDLFCGRWTVLGVDVTEARWAVVRTPAASFLRRVLHSRHLRGTGLPDRLRSATAHALGDSREQFMSSRMNVVVVLVESWGQFQEPALQGKLETSYLGGEIKKRYSVETGTVPFYGPTIGGETRELCGQGFQNGIAAATSAELRNCVPGSFARQGYTTLAVHGFRPSMYGRNRWYPRIGFSRYVFGPELMKYGLNTCPGGLTGTCDSDVANWLKEPLAASTSEHPLFAYWVTLNSHLPVEPESLLSSAAHCESVSPLLQDRGLCAWYGLIEKVHRNVAQLALSATRPTVFIVTGDHAPPFYSNARRQNFSQTVVPYVILRPLKS